MEPSVLVMDEPTAGLDAQARRRIVALLERFEHTMIVATHDMDMAADLCERTIILDNGIIAADGAACDILSDNDLFAEVRIGDAVPVQAQMPAGRPERHIGIVATLFSAA